MRAAVITRPGGPEVLEIQNVTTPEPVGHSFLCSQCSATFSQRSNHTNYRANLSSERD